MKNKNTDGNEIFYEENCVNFECEAYSFMPHYDKINKRRIDSYHRHIFNYDKDGKLIKPEIIEILD